MCRKAQDIPFGRGPIDCVLVGQPRAQSIGPLPTSMQGSGTYNEQLLSFHGMQACVMLNSVMKAT